MKRSTVVFSLVAVAGLGLSAHVSAAPPKPAAAAPQQEAPTVPSLATMLEGFRWGTNHADVIKAHNQVNGVYDKEYNPQLVKMQPGVRMQAVESERETRKLQFANSWLEFKDTPVGYDTSGLKGEYSYKNHEAALRAEWPGKRRFFFFINDRLWKIYDEVKLVDGGPMGKSYPEAVQKVNSTLGVAGRAKNADPDKGVFLPYTEWQDASTHLRLVNRTGEGMVGIVLEDKSTLANLPQLRANKLDDPTAMDPSIKQITSGGITDPNAKPQPGQGGDAGAPKPKPKAH